MRNRGYSLLQTLVIASVLLASFTGAWARSGRFETPRHFRAGLSDHGLVEVEAVAQDQVWAAWALRNGPEYNIAVSLRDADGTWNPVRLIGSDDGRDQLDPTLAVDRLGNLYLAYASEGGGISLTVRDRDGRWQRATQISPIGVVASRPTLQMLGDRLILAYVVDGVVKIEEVDTDADGGGMVLHDFEDGPDPVEKEDDGTDGDPDDDSEDEKDESVGGFGPAVR
ncbi:MAG: hypothetical protein OES25_12135 [Acidobacteriota bacterium]|nr:hypothetical protein [Acidobacteriota bacterium]